MHSTYSEWNWFSIKLFFKNWFSFVIHYSNITSCTSPPKKYSQGLCHTLSPHTTLTCPPVTQGEHRCKLLKAADNGRESAHLFQTSVQSVVKNSLHGFRHLLQRLDSMNRENTVLAVMHGKDPTPKLLWYKQDMSFYKYWMKKKLRSRGFGRLGCLLTEENEVRDYLTLFHLEHTYYTGSVWV